MKRKFLSLFLVISMFVGVCSSVRIMAAETNVVIHEDLQGEWALEYRYASDSEDGVNRIVKTAVGEAYEGDRSMHIKHISNDTTTQDWGGGAYAYASGSLKITRTDVALDSTKNYTFSFYGKGLSTSCYIIYYFDNNGTKYETQKTSIFTQETPEDAEKAEDGWVKYTTTVANPTKFQMNIHFESDIYLDNMSLVAEGSDEESFTHGDFEVEPPVVVTHEDLQGEWALEYRYASDSEDGVNRIIKTAVGEAYEGDRSMHIKHISNDTTTQNWGGGAYAYASGSLKITRTDVALDSTKNYTFSFYGKGLSTSCYIIYYFDNNGTKYETQKTSIFTHETPEDAEKAEDGWVKYTTTVTNPTKFQMNIHFESDIYLDNISLVAEGSDEESFTHGDFEVEPPVVVTHEDLQGEWTLTYGYASDSEDGVNRIVKTAVGEAYEGDRSIHIKHISNDTTTQNWGGAQAYSSGSLKITRTDITLDSTKNYTFSFYGKGLSTSCYIIYYFDNNGTKYETQKTSIFTQETPEDAEKAEDGWVKYTTTVTNPTKFQMNIHFESDIYLDNISLVAEDGLVNVFSYGDFELSQPGDDDEEENVPSFVYYGDLDGWTVEYKADGAAGEVDDGKNRMVRVANGESYSGNRSLYVKYSSTAPTESWGGYTGNNLKISKTGIVSEEGKTYTLSFYMKGGSASSYLMLYLDSGNTTKYETHKQICNPTTPENAAKAEDGWMKYTINNISDPSKLLMVVQMAVEVYIDDITLTEDGSANLISNGNFETAPKVCAPKLYDESGAEIKALSSEESGKTLTAAATLNCIDGTAVSGQLIVCVYNGYELQTINYSKIESATENDNIKILTCDIEIPEFTEVGNYKVRTFVWKDFDSIVPLCTSVEF